MHRLRRFLLVDIHPVVSAAAACVLSVGYTTTQPLALVSDGTLDFNGFGA